MENGFKAVQIFPSPMGEDRISKFVRTLEILGEGRWKVESGFKAIWCKACKSLSLRRGFNVYYPLPFP